MVDPFPPASPPPPPPPPPPNPGQPVFAAPSPAGATPFQPGPYLAPPPPQQSSGCFKGCCIGGVIVGVIGIVCVIGLATNYKKLIAWSLIKTSVEPSDMRQDEKDEASQILRAYVNLVFGPKASDARYLTEYNRNQADLQAAAGDGKVEAREVRPVIARIKKLLKDEGQSWPSALFSMGKYGVRVLGMDEARRAEIIELVASKLNITPEVAGGILKQTPAVVSSGLLEGEAESLGRELEAAGCKVEIFPIAESAH